MTRFLIAFFIEKTSQMRYKFLCDRTMKALHMSPDHPHRKLADANGYYYCVRGFERRAPELASLQPSATSIAGRL